MSGRDIDVPAAIRPAAWWSQTGSNRRPHACKARALPTELWPLLTPTASGRTGCRAAGSRQRRRESMVGLGRLELPTSRLSSARSNQLSYKPEPLRSTSIAKRHRNGHGPGHVTGRKSCAEKLRRNVLGRRSWPSSLRQRSARASPLQ
jgi:hypothetical protein